MSEATIEDTALARRPAPRPLATLVDRFDRSVIDIPGGRARIRLFVEAFGAWDFVLDRIDSRLEPAAEQVEPDAMLLADAATWQRIADDVRGGMAAYRERRPRIRKNHAKRRPSALPIDGRIGSGIDVNKDLNLPSRNN